MPRITLVAALFGGAAAQLGSHQTLAGYESASNIEPHSKIDLDMEELETKVGEYATNTNWKTEAMFIYENGGGGLCQTTDVGATATPWCTDTTKALGNSQKSDSVRTLKGFATKDYSSLTGTYAEQLPPIYTAYWTANGMTAAEAAKWADTFITKDYSAISRDVGTNQLIKKGANYHAVWMYVLHELEDAIGDCYKGDILANDNTPTGGAPHAWDEAWAFYAGSQVAATAADSVTDDGTLIWELTEKRSDDFGTDHSTGPATTNVNLLAEFIKGRDLIIAGKCAEAEPVVQTIIQMMTIPLVQGTLKYAWKADPAISGKDCEAGVKDTAGKTAMLADDSCVKSWAEGWAFAAAVLPQLDQCSSTAAKTVKDNLDIAAAAPMKDGFAAVKAAFEQCYCVLGMTCADVGAYDTSWSACTAGTCAPTPMPVAAASDDATAPALALGAAAAAGAALLL